MSTVLLLRLIESIMCSMWGKEISPIFVSSLVPDKKYSPHGWGFWIPHGYSWWVLLILHCCLTCRTLSHTVCYGRIQKPTPRCPVSCVMAKFPSCKNSWGSEHGFKFATIHLWWRLHISKILSKNRLIGQLFIPWWI